MEFVGVRAQSPPASCAAARSPARPCCFALIGHWGIGAPIGLYLCEAMGQGVVGLWIGLTVGTLFTSVLTVHHLFARAGSRLGANAL